MNYICSWLRSHAARALADLSSKGGTMKSYNMRKAFFMGLLSVVLVFTPVTYVVAQSCPPPPSGLVSWWPAEGDASDIQGSNNGLEGTVAFAPGKVGQGFALNGASYVEVPDNPTLDPGSGSFSLEAWVRPVADTRFHVVFNKYEAGKACISGVSNSFYSLGINGSGFVDFRVRDSNAIFKAVIGSSNVKDGDFHHLVATLDGSSGTLNIYVDGVSDGSGPLPNAFSTIKNDDGSADPLLIGASRTACSDSATNFFSGNIDEAAYHSRALSAAEVASIFDACSNEPPTADAGTGETVHPGTLVTLDGTGSSDPDLDGLDFDWQITDAPVLSTATLSDATVTMPSFTPDFLGNYTIRLTVTEQSPAPGLSSVDEVVVSTFNSAPVADAGSDQAIIVIGTTVQLDGSQSYDDDSDEITFLWSLTKPGDSSAVLSDVTSSDPFFGADVQGDYTASLVVTDVFGASSEPDPVVVSFTNVVPVADAGDTPAGVVVGDTVFLDGSESFDANEDPLTFSWNFISTPTDSSAVIVPHGVGLASFNADLPGSYTASLVVNDGFVDSPPDNVTITAISTEDAATQTLAEATDTINLLEPTDFKNAKMKKALTNKINAVLDKIERGQVQEAIDKLVHDILGKTNGCADTGNPDKNDKIRNCDAQELLYPLIVDAIALLGG